VYSSNQYDKQSLERKAREYSRRNAEQALAVAQSNWDADAPKRELVHEVKLRIEEAEAYLTSRGFQLLGFTTLPTINARTEDKR
jgi:hypothetical protein